ncbi:MAG: hypothetical protein IIC52_13090 [Proteobacteria bacterium]|nr:hypothetical protein [Pseudomonadota bacterium]
MDEAMNAQGAMAMTKDPAKPVGKPAIPGPIDLDRVVFDPEYRDRVRDALNRAGRAPRPRPGRAARRKGRAGT